MILETLIRQKRFFDDKSDTDIDLAKKFFEEHRWGMEGCPFVLEYPYMSVPDMIRDKLVHKTLGLEYNRRHHWDVK
jgi:hypothetical protein